MVENMNGYQVLKKDLIILSNMLAHIGQEDLAKLILNTSRLCGMGSPTEYLGESWQSLKEVLSHETNAEIHAFALHLSEDIRAGFAKVGQDLPKLK